MTYTALLKGQLRDKNRNTVPKNPGRLSCFFGSAMPHLFQTSLIPLYSFNDLTLRASIFQRLPLEKGTVGFGEQLGALWQTAPPQECRAARAETLPEAPTATEAVRETSVHFPVDVTANCSESIYLIAVRPADKTARYHFPR